MNLDPNTLCQRYLHILYQDAQRNSTHENQITETYGEILYPSVNTLISLLSLTEHDVFVDLGSGLGKIVLQVFLCSPVKEARGIEILPHLHNQALAVAHKLREELPDFYAGERQLTFLSDDFLQTSLDGITVALICSQCYSQTMLHQLGTIIENTATIHTVLSLRPISNLQRLRLTKVVRIQCSWDTALCYVYVK